MNRIRETLPVLALIVLIASCGPPRNDVEDEAASAAQADTVAESALSFGVMQYRSTATTLAPSDGYPRSTVGGTRWNTVSPHDWTSGFFPGVLWQLADYTRDEQLRTWAHDWTVPLVEIFEGAYDHDLGFQFNSSFGQALRITGDDTYREPLLEAAERLADRFNPTVGAIKSWDWSDRWDFPVIVDNLMNLELVVWAAENGGDPAWRDVAIQHGLTTIRDHVRPDGGTFHVVNYDPSTGEVVERVTHQGAADTSTWARGQAWALYGFTMMHRETEVPEFLETAQRVANYFITNLPEDGIPYWDFQAPGIPDAARDVSAAAIAASALLELGGFVSPQDADRYKTAAHRILVSLSNPPYLAEGTESPSILLHAVGNHPAGTEIDVGLIYADFYYVEALRRLGARRALE